MLSTEKENNNNDYKNNKDEPLNENIKEILYEDKSEVVKGKFYMSN